MTGHLKFITRNKEIIIKEADKDGAVVIMKTKHCF